MELKDVIHFYLGCNGLYSMADEPDAIESKLDFDLLNRLSRDPDETCFQPYLRPLSDMTEEEMKECIGIGNLMYSGGTPEQWVQGWRAYCPEVFLYLITHQFDLFDLISSGQAIDKTKQ